MYVVRINCVPFCKQVRLVLHPVSHAFMMHILYLPAVFYGHKVCGKRDVPYFMLSMKGTLSMSGYAYGIINVSFRNSMLSKATWV